MQLSVEAGSLSCGLKLRPRQEAVGGRGEKVSEWAAPAGLREPLKLLPQDGKEEHEQCPEHQVPWQGDGGALGSSSGGAASPVPSVMVGH